MITINVTLISYTNGITYFPDDAIDTLTITPKKNNDIHN